MGIVIGSTFKGIIAGLIIGLVAQRTQSLPIGIVVGLAVGASLAYSDHDRHARTSGRSCCRAPLVGLIVGYATFTYAGRDAASRGREVRDQGGPASANPCP